MCHTKTLDDTLCSLNASVNRLCKTAMVFWPAQTTQVSKETY